MFHQEPSSLYPTNIMLWYALYIPDKNCSWLSLTKNRYVYVEHLLISGSTETTEIDSKSDVNCLLLIN